MRLLVVLVVGHEAQVEARVAPHHERVFDVVAVEADGIVADGRRKRVSEQTYLVIVNVHVGEGILERAAEDVARFKEIVDAVGVLTHDDVAVGRRILPVDLARHGLRHVQRQDELAVLRAQLHLVHQPLALAEQLAREVFGRDVVQSERQFLVFVVLVEVVVLQFGALLGGNDAPHELHGRVVLARVAMAFLLHGDACQLVGLGFQGDAHFLFGVRTDAQVERFVPECAESKRPSVVSVDGEPAVLVGRHHDVVPFVDGTCVGDGVSCGVVHDDARQFLCEGRG